MKNERTIDWYLEKAKDVSGITSNRKLGADLGISEGAMSHFKTGRALPSDATMIRLADLAKVDPYIALLDLNTWRTEGDAKKAYADILRKLGQASVVAAIIIPTTSAPALAFAGVAVTGATAVPVIMGMCLCILWKIIYRVGKGCLSICFIKRFLLFISRV